LVDARLIARFEITRPWPSRLPANSVEESPIVKLPIGEKPLADHMPGYLPPMARPLEKSMLDISL